MSPAGVLWALIGAVSGQKPASGTIWARSFM
jgi:hypothetical protein